MFNLQFTDQFHNFLGPAAVKFFQQAFDLGLNRHQFHTTQGSDLADFIPLKQQVNQFSLQALAELRCL